MTKTFQQYLFIILGWLCVVLGVIGLIVPGLPGFVFLIAALALFSKSSERFHQMLLTNKWFGEALSQWDSDKSISRKTKIKASVFLVCTFIITIYIFRSIPLFQIGILSLGGLLLLVIWKIKEK